ncbi:MAG: hypothetical protein NTW95_10570 [Candidatus Aminicenantes bacterium]|nr:hypothetical protein [Candidatus Aminicenantes bacterium]
MMKRTFVLFFLVLLLAACVSPVRVYYFPGARHYPPTKTSSVELLRWEPQRPYEAFAEIRYDPPRGYSRNEVEWRLREKGADIGADALVISVDTIYRERVWVGPYHYYRNPHVGRAVAVVRDFIIEAVAIRYH